MSIIDLLVLAAIAGVCGVIGQAIAGVSRGGCLTSIGFGFVGALIGLGAVRYLDLPTLLTFEAGSVSFPLVWTIVGAAAFVAAITALRGRAHR